MQYLSLLQACGIMSEYYFVELGFIIHLNNNSFIFVSLTVDVKSISGSLGVRQRCSVDEIPVYQKAYFSFFYEQTRIYCCVYIYSRYHHHCICIQVRDLNRIPPSLRQGVKKRSKAFGSLLFHKLKKAYFISFFWVLKFIMM